MATFKYDKANETTIVKCGKMQFDMVDIDLKTAKEVVKQSKAHQWWVEFLETKAKGFTLANKNEFLSMSDSLKFFYATARKAVDSAIREGYTVTEAISIGNALVDGDESELMAMPLDGRVLGYVKEAMNIKLKGRVA